MYKLIIVDDEPFIREGLLCRIDWNAIGFQVAATLEDGSEVLDYLSRERVDIIITDICMLQVSGLELAAVIRKRHPGIRIVIISGHRNFEFAQEAIRCGIYEYLLKPLDYDLLCKTVERIKLELDKEKKESLLLQSIGEAEYETALSIIRSVTDSTLGKDEYSWLTYVRLKPMLNEAPEEIRGAIVKQLWESMKLNLNRLDPQIAHEFNHSLMALNLTKGENISQQISQVFKDLNDKLIARDLLFTGKGKGDDLIAKACSYIANHLGDNLTYKEVADFVHISPRHFIRRFRAEKGETFSDYVFRVRMEGAMRLLREGQVAPEDVSLAVGYHDDKYFQQLFKKYTGCSIWTYRGSKGGIDNK